jgi:NTE family protein
VLSGGGNLGALQVGMLRALTEHGLVPDLVLGCSVGAMNGAAYSRAPTRAGVLRLEAHWLGVGSPQLMPSSRIPSAVQLLRKGASLHRNDGLRSSLEDVLGDARCFEDLELAFQCVATEVDSARERWFGEGDLVPALLASAALPAVFPPVELDGQRYVDGGVVDNVPIARAVELGCTRLFVLHVGAQGRPDADLRRPIDGALLAYWLARNSRFARDLAALPQGVEAIVLPPGERPELRYDDFSQSEGLIDQGYRNTTAFLDERADRLAAEEERRSWRTRLRRLRLPMGSGAVEGAELAATDPAGAVVGVEVPESVPDEALADTPDDSAETSRVTGG